MVSYSVTGIRGGGGGEFYAQPFYRRTVASEFTKAANYSNRSPGTHVPSGTSLTSSTVGSLSVYCSNCIACSGVDTASDRLVGRSWLDHR